MGLRVCLVTPFAWSQPHDVNTHVAGVAGGLASRNIKNPGKKIGQAQISEKHSNYIVNLGGASAQDVLSLASLAKKTVKEQYGIDLEMEVQYVL